MRMTTIAALFCATAASTAAAAIVGPPIAYGTSSTIYLVNPDGTGLRAVYQAPRKAVLTGFSIRPGGGEIAFIENKKLKVLDYDDRGVAIGTARSVSIACGTVLEPDYGPDGALAVKDGCPPNSIWRVAPGASSADPTPLVSNPQTIGDVMWSRDGGRIYYDLADGVYAYDVSSGTSALVLSPDHSMWDVTQTGDRLILGSTNSNYFVHDVATGTDTPGCTQALNVHYGNNDTQMVYRLLAHGGGSYVLLLNSNCSGAPFRITGKAGAYLNPDWATP